MNRILVLLLCSLAISSLMQPLWAASLATLKKDFMYHTKQAYECLITNKNCDAQTKKTYLIGALILALLAVGIPSSVYLYKHKRIKPLSLQEIEIELNKPLSPQQIELNKQLIKAALWGNPDRLQELLNEGAQINAFHDVAIPGGRRGVTALNVAIRSKNKENIKFLLEHGANPNMSDESGTPMQHAIYDGYTDGTRLLVQYGTEVNFQDNDGDTPLMWAIQEDHQDIVKILLNAGAKANIKNNMGETALYKAVNNNKIEITKDLLKAGANPNIKNKYGETVLDLRLNKPMEDLLKGYKAKSGKELP